MRCSSCWNGRRRKKRLQDDPSLIDTAVDEFLRFQSPNQLGNRMTTEDVEFHGKTIPAGTRIHLCIGAAQPRPAASSRSPTGSICRENPTAILPSPRARHLCAGFSLARLEGRIAIARFLERFPDYALAGEPKRTGRVRFRGFANLPAARELKRTIR